MTPEPTIHLEDVWFSYDGASVLENVSLRIQEREFVWIVGPNGGGKTTLLKLILGLLKPTAGRVRVLAQAPRQARSRIGYMPQQVSLDPRFPVDVLDVVLMGRLGRGSPTSRYRSSDREAAESALRAVGLFELRCKPYGELSGGQLRRLFIARALACEPELLVLDEPTANLDPLVQRELHDLLRELSSRLTVVMVSHDPAFVSEFVQQVVCVNRKVHVHPTGELDGAMLSELYGEEPLRIVRHDQHFGNGKSYD